MDDPIINFNNGNLSISNLKNHNNLSISIYNTQGQIVFVDYTLKNDESYQTQITLSEGIYLLDIIYYQTKRYSKKF
nr:T9SS type A sorting domain-containing protein [Bacteroidota bacterium]